MVGCSDVGLTEGDTNDIRTYELSDRDTDMLARCMFQHEGLLEACAASGMRAIVHFA